MISKSYQLYPKFLMKFKLLVQARVCGRGGGGGGGSTEIRKLPLDPLLVLLPVNVPKTPGWVAYNADWSGAAFCNIWSGDVRVISRPKPFQKFCWRQIINQPFCGRVVCVGWRGRGRRGVCVWRGGGGGGVKGDGATRGNLKMSPFAKLIIFSA